MKKRFAYWKLVRPVNLSLIVLTQVVIWWVIHASEHLSKDHFWIICLLSIYTVLIAAAGYVINDLQDVQTDHLNKPGQNMIGELVTPLQATRYYRFLILLSGLAAVGLTINGLMLALPLWLILSGVLYQYSCQWKCRPLIGNLIVAALCALVPLLVWWTATRSFQWQISASSQTTIHFYVVFAFLSTLYRELIKDMEDRSGDAAMGCRTYAVTRGAVQTQRLALGIGGVLSLVVAIFLSTRVHLSILAFVYGWLVLVGTGLLLMVTQVRMATASNYTLQSRWIKLWMVLGLIGLLLF